MAQINTAKPLRFASGDEMAIRATGDTDPGDEVLNIIAGSLQINVPGEETIELPDKGQIGSSGTLLAGDERPIEINVNVRFTAASLDVSQIIDQMTQASADGKRPTFELIFKFYDAERHDATNGFTLTFTECFLPEGFSLQTAGGQDSDTLQMTVRSFANAFTKSDFP